jgi:FkbM family methyltransferase
VLEHLVDPWSVLRRLRDAAAPGGRVQVSVPNARHLSLALDLFARGTFGYAASGHRDNTHLRWFTRRDIVGAVQTAGWQVDSVSHTRLSLPPPDPGADHLRALERVPRLPVVRARDSGAMSFLWRLQPWLTHAVSSNRRRRLTRGIARVATAYLDAYENFSYNTRRNGERHVVERVSGTNPACVFDVGANVGEWTEMALSLCPGARFHCFEIVEPTAEQLEARFAGEERVTTVATGLGRDSNPVTIKYFPESPARSGVAYEGGGAFELVSCPVQRGDEYCAERGIERIDLLKLDVEGMEYDAMLGFGGMLEDGSIGVLQFEYGRVNILTGVLLRDLNRFLTERDYSIGKVFPGGVDFRPYRLTDEDFRGPNYLAVHRRQGKLLDALSLA